MKCAAHPNVETNISCSKCGKPICPRCLVQTPVGARCPECGRGQRIGRLELGVLDYGKAVLGGMGAAVGCGIIWYLALHMIPFVGFLNFFIAAAAGYAVGEATSRSVNRKRNRGLKVLAGMFAVIAFLIGNQFTPTGQLILNFNVFNLLALAVGIYMAVSRT